MANNIKKGESILIPFRYGISISDSQMKPRMYKTMQAFKKSFPGKKDGVELVEYAEVVRCKDCKYAKNMAPIGESEYEIGECLLRKEDEIEFMVYDDDFCSYGERKDND